MWLVSLRDLQFRARRFVIAIVVTSLVFGIALAIDGMRRSVQHESPAIVAMFGADRWFVAKGATGPFSTTSVVDATKQAEHRQAPRVRRSEAYWLSRTVVWGAAGKESKLVGEGPGGLGSPSISEGRGVKRSGEAVISSGISSGVGGQVVVGGKSFKVVGKTGEGRYYFGVPSVFVS